VSEYELPPPGCKAQSGSEKLKCQDTLGLCGPGTSKVVALFPSKAFRGVCNASQPEPFQ